MEELKKNAHTRTIGIVMNGVTGRMGTNQHLKRSIVPIIKQEGIELSDGTRLVPDPVLTGRNAAKLEHLADETGIEKWTTDVEEALDNPANEIYFDSQITNIRFESVSKAIAAGKHVYCEKPSAPTTEQAMALYRQAHRKGVKHGVVQDKLWLPGFRKLKALTDKDFFGKILSVQANFGYWVFEGDVIPPQRPSWNYRKEDGGGIILDMFPHWHYIIENLFGAIRELTTLGATHLPVRYEDSGQAYEATADDAAYAIFVLEGGVIAQFNSSWTTRVRRDDLLALQVDGTNGSAVIGLRNCYIQPYGATPRPVWNPDVEREHSFYDDWLPASEQQDYENAFKVQWELFLKHVAEDTPFPWNLLAGAKGVQLAELGYASWQERAWLTVPELEAEVLM